MDQPIVFLSPASMHGKSGIQRVDDSTHSVTAVLLISELGGEVDVGDLGVSYKAVENAPDSQ